jgi:dTDP-4-dehydrorhamnose 3,5-epimerase
MIDSISSPTFIDGSFFSDTRGRIDFVNDFVVNDFIRVYRITHDDISVIRAWQGHRIEVKAFWVVKGSFVINAVKVNDFDNINKEIKPEAFKLEANESKILVIPGGYANGFKALEEDSIMVVFSNLGLDDSAKDMVRIDLNAFEFLNP